MNTRLSSNLAVELQRFAANRDDIWVLDGDLGDSYGLYDGSGRPKFSNFLQMGIAEQTMVAAAAGLASVDQLPWVFSFSAFLCHRACDQIRTCIAHTSLPVVLVGSHAGAATGSNGKSHAAISDLSVMLGFNVIETWLPADRSDIALIVKDMIQRPRPAYIRLGREGVSDLPLPPGYVRSNKQHGDVLILTTGFASHWVPQVLGYFEQRGIHLPWTHINHVHEASMRQLYAYRPELKVLFVIEDHSPIGGLADLARRYFGRSVDVYSRSWPAHWHGESGSIEDLRREFKLDAESLASSLEVVIEKHTNN